MHAKLTPLWRVVAAILLLPLSARAQTSSTGSPPSPVNDMIDRATGALNNLKYAEALDLAREALQVTRIRPAQQIVLYQLMAAAFYPDPEEGGKDPQPDSAAFYLRRAIRLKPDIQLADEYRWSGIDSLFRVTKSRTFAAVARPSAENALTGTDGRAFIEVVSTRPAVMYLRSRAIREGVVMTHDSSTGQARARLALRAHDGTVAQFATGEYEIRIEVRDLESGEADTLRFSAIATGLPPTLDRLPTLDSSALKPERAGKTRTSGIVAGVLVGSATIAMSLFGRSEEPIRSAFKADGRARLIGFSIAAGAITGGWLDKGMRLPNNVAANTLMRAEHARAVTAAQDANRKRVAEYRVELRIDSNGAR